MLVGCFSCTPHRYIKADNINLWGIQLTSCLFCLDSAALLILKEQQFYLFGPIQNSQTGGQLFSNTSPFAGCSLIKVAALPFRMGQHYSKVLQLIPDRHRLWSLLRHCAISRPGKSVNLLLIFYTKNKWVVTINIWCSFNSLQAYWSIHKYVLVYSKSKQKYKN